MLLGGRQPLTRVPGAAAGRRPRPPVRCWGERMRGLTAPVPPGEVEEEMENPEMVDLPEKLKHQLRHRELFLSRQLESLPATHIR